MDQTQQGWSFAVLLKNKLGGGDNVCRETDGLQFVAVEPLIPPPPMSVPNKGLSE